MVLSLDTGGILWVVAIIAFILAAALNVFNDLIFAGMLLLFAKWSLDNSTRASAAGGDRSLAFVMLGLGALAFVIAMNQIQPGFFGGLNLPFSVGADAAPGSGAVDWSNMFKGVSYENSVLAKLDPAVLMALGLGVVYALSKNQKKFQKFLNGVF